MILDLSVNKYSKCPICSKIFVVEETEGWRIKIHGIAEARVFLCLNPLASDPLHYYTHIVDTSSPNQMAIQEFSLDLGNKSVLFSNDYVKKNSQIKFHKDGTPLVFPALLVPDFPKLVSLKNKVRTIITFG
jgi:hypothetical protein